MSLEGLESPLAIKRVLKQPRLFTCTLEEAAFDSFCQLRELGRREGRNKARHPDGSWKQQQKQSVLSVLEIQKHEADSSGS